MKYRLGIFLAVLFSFFVFGELIITSEATTVKTGSDMLITLEGNYSNVSVDVENGGLDNPDIFFDGLNFENERASFVYLAPFGEGISKITFITDTGEEYIYEIKVSDYDEIDSKTSLYVEDIFGPNLKKNSEDDVWEPFSVQDKIYEGDEILIASGGYLYLKGPEEINIEISENTQILFEKLRYENEKIDIQYKVKKGVTYNTINKKLTPGSKFIVSNNNSVSAGVRGTRFTFENKKTTKIRVYEGTVFASFKNKMFSVSKDSLFSIEDGFEEPFIDPVDISEEAMKDENFNPPENTPENIPDNGNKEENQDENNNDGENNNDNRSLGDTPEDNTDTDLSADAGNVEFGTINKNQKNYFIYSIAPTFDLGFIKLSIGFDAYQEELGGTLFFGTPSDNNSTDIINALTLKRLGLFFDKFYINYGSSSLYTEALGMLMNRYYVPYSNVFDFGLNIGNIMTNFHIPYELVKINPFSIKPSSSLYYGNMSLAFGKNTLGLTYIYDHNFQNNTINAFSSSLYRDFLGIKLGAELDGLYTSDTLGLGGIVGAFLDVPPLIQFYGGLVYSGNNFMPQIFNTNYEMLKITQGIEIPKNGYGIGIVGNLEMSLMGFAKFNADYKNYFSTGYDTLSADLKIKIENMIPNVPSLTIGGKYENNGVNITKLLDDNTFYQLYIFYPVVGENGIIGSYSWDPVTQKVVYTILFSNNQ